LPPLPPPSWSRLYAVLAVWLILCLALAFLLDWLKAIL